MAASVGATNSRSDAELEAAVRRLAAAVPPLDRAAEAAARARQARLIKPTGALGRLEGLAIRVAGMTGRERPRCAKRLIAVFAADHGVAREGVSAYPTSVTAQMVGAFAAGVAAVSVLGRRVGARLLVVDVGVAADLPPHPAVLARKVRRGTDSLARGPAMARRDALAAILVGAAAIDDELARGLDVVALGEMGIANSTAAAALAATLLGLPPLEVVGRGTGVDDDGLARKLAAIERGLAINRPDPADPIDALARVGGLEIAALAGAALAAARARVPVVLDGFICATAALAAARLTPALGAYLIAGHRSTEPGHRRVLEALGLDPLLELEMRLGEASGAGLALSIVDAALATHDEMATFDEAAVDDRPAPAPPHPLSPGPHPLGFGPHPLGFGPHPLSPSPSGMERGNIDGRGGPSSLTRHSCPPSLRDVERETEGEAGAGPGTLGEGTLASAGPHD